MTGAQLLRQLFDEKVIAVLQVLIQDPKGRFTLKDLAEKSDVPLATTHRIIKHLTHTNIIQQHKIKHLTLNQLADSEDAEYMQKLLFEKPAPIAKFVDLIRPIAGIEQAIMHGKEEANKANIVIIGNNIDREQVNAAVALIQEEGFRISHLILEKEQYQMLESMGQFSGQKTPLLN